MTARFLLRRLAQSIGVLLVSTFIMYFLASIAVDPLDDLRQSVDPNADFLIQRRTEMLALDQPIFVRYLDWIGGYAGCLIGQCDLGTAWRTGESVAALIGTATLTSLRLILVATVLAIALGVGIGILSALRQYSAFDYTITFISFVLYSLPAFWVAVLLKQWGAIGFNDFLSDPVLPWWIVLLVSVIMGALGAAVIGGTWKRRVVFCGIGIVTTAGVLLLLTVGGWLVTPTLGLPAIAVMGLGVAILVTWLVSGLRARSVLISAVLVVVVAAVAYFPLQYLFASSAMSHVTTVLLLIAFCLVGIGLGALLGGTTRGQAMRAGGITGIAMFLFVFVDRMLPLWPAYMSSSAIRNRPVATIGAATPQLGGDYWIQSIDSVMHLVLPTLALVLISFASYTRYARGSMLEVLNQDYVRTARAKGLSERTVIMRHAFRGALVPLATIVPVDLITLVGGAVITETVFGWSGMGALFISSLRDAEVDVLMAYIAVVGLLAVIGNLVADLSYAALDPRVRAVSR